MNKGFVLLFAILVSSVILAVGMGAFNISLKELALSAAGRDSQVAFYWADSGSECAFYWERRFPDLDDTPFPYKGGSSVISEGGTATVECGAIFDSSGVATKQNIISSGGIPQSMWSPSSGNNRWHVSPAPPAQTGGIITETSPISTTFIVSPYSTESDRKSHGCARVTVKKESCAAGYIKTTITSEGFSICDASNTRAIKRTIENSYPNLSTPCN